MSEGETDPEPPSEPPPDPAPRTMATVESILRSAGDAGLVVAPVKPYHWTGAEPDIPFTRANTGLIGMTYVHEGVVPPPISAEAFEAAEAAVHAPDSGSEVKVAYETIKVKKIIAENYAKYSNWYLVLVACEQVRGLGQSNLDNFAKMCKADPFPAKASVFISYWAAARPSLAAEDKVREKYESNRFFEYHTTGSSTPLLCKQAMEEVEGLSVFSEEEFKLVDAAIKSVHDLDAARKIPSITLVKTSAILEASATLPETWYMGSKAVDRYSGKRYTAIVKHLKAIFTIQTRVDELPDMDMSTLVTSLDDLLKFGKSLSPGEDTSPSVAPGN